MGVHDMIGLLVHLPALFAARGGETDPAITLIGILVLVVVGIIIAIREAGARYDVVEKGSLPYCPRCNRQVTYRRDHCRSCGYQFKTYGNPSPSPMLPTRPVEYPRRMMRDLEREQRAEQKRKHEKIELDIKLEDEEACRVAFNAAEQARRDEWYRSRGAEPGSRWAWFKVLPDLVQVMIMVLVFAVPGVAILVLIARNL
jgi:predicted RNA-binding Zn-ribbon protein involved in translation (DUF1610 family)